LVVFLFNTINMNVVITGSGKGIGFELALRFANEGHSVLGISRSLPSQLSKHNNITCLSVDLSDSKSVSKIGDYIKNNVKTVDVLIHNAGTLILKPFASLTIEDFRNVYDVNVFAVALLTQQLLPFMKKGGHVVTISSMGGIQGSMKFSGLAAYSSSKAAVITLSELLAEEYKDFGIHFNVLALGAVQTEMLEQAFPGYQASVNAQEMADYIYKFSIFDYKFFNGKVLQVSSSTP
jgi:NAD(P)-dependent dehydrogenase (short-subunit alcohol dehydrogenase family)